MSRRVLSALVKKDLRLFITDRRAVVVSFLLPALLALFMGASVKIGANIKTGDGGVHIASVVVDHDHSPGSGRIVVALAKSQVFTSEQMVDDIAATDLVRRGKTDVAFVIPERFAAAALAAARDAGAAPSVTIISDPTQRVTPALARAQLTPLVLTSLAPDLGPDVVRCATQGAPFTATITSAGSGDAGFDWGAHALAGMGIQFILIGAVDSAVGLINDRQRGLLKRVRAAPISRGTLIASRLASGAVTALAVLVFLYVFGHFTMGVAIRGSLLGFGLVAVSFALVASAIGLLIATIGKTPQATRGLGIFVVLVATMLSGAWFPTSFFPDWLQTATKVVPTRWAVDGLDAMSWKGLPLADALPAVGVLLLTATLCAAWATARFRWEE